MLARKSTGAGKEGPLGMITVLESSHGHCIRAACDICRKPIEDHTTAFAAYSQADGVLEIHHFTCAQDGSTHPAFTLPLDVALVEIVASLGIDWEEAKIKAGKAAGSPYHSVEQPDE
jgi:hypothetical protein